MYLQSELDQKLDLEKIPFPDMIEAINIKEQTGEKRNIVIYLSIK